MKYFKLIFILTTVVLFRGTTIAQTNQWQKVIGDRTVNEECKTSVKLHPNLYVHGGTYLDRSGSVGQYRPFLLFTSANGDSLRSVKLSAIKGDLSGLAPADSGGVVALGFFVNQSNLLNTFLISFDSLGTIRWQRNFNLPGDGSKTYRIEEVPDGYLLMANKSNNSQNFSNSNSVIKTDRKGNLLWQRTFDFNALATSVTPMQDGSYMVLGYTTIGSTGSPTSPFSLNLRLINITPDGDTIRTKVIGSPTDREFGNSIKQTSDGGFIVVGDFVQNVSGTKRQGYAVKLDSLLNVEWEVKIMPD
ncbi:MAG: hypothetical protein LPK21_12620, partial [Hymenobacteraceae bacterium]|nr:hypothetical protein [Hymenobacteraceae bacterium]